MKLPLFIVRFTRYEYWPWILFYLPVLPYWLYLGIKNRSLAYFTVANPGIELGGFYGESKSDILNLIDKQYLPAFIEVKDMSFAHLLILCKEHHLAYPMIAKPDVGERGDFVAKINSENELESYHKMAKGKYIVQEFISYEIELGVLYSRLPTAEKGRVTSITLKEFLSVTGDGKSTVEELMETNNRARFQMERIRKEIGSGMDRILMKDEKLLLEPIGNHCRGTKFINQNNLINENIDLIFDKICKPIRGFYYGRFDLKVKSFEDFKEGKNIRIMELNGASSEPGHIYDPGFTLYNAYKDLCLHWKRLSDISRENIINGYKPVSFLLILKSYFKFVVFK